MGLAHGQAPALIVFVPRLDLPHGQVFLGLRTARDLFRSHPHLTRLYGAFSPADMTRDPVFGFPAADLPDVASTVDADAEVPCAGGGSRAPLLWGYWLVRWPYHHHHHHHYLYHHHHHYHNTTTMASRTSTSTSTSTSTTTITSTSNITSIITAT